MDSTHTRDVAHRHRAFRQLLRVCAASTFIFGAVACGDSSDPSAPQVEAPVPGDEGPQPGQANHPQFIVTLAPQANPRTVASEHGVSPRFVYSQALNGFAGTISEAARSGLLRDARVVRVEKDGPVAPGSAGDQWGAAWGLDRIDQRTLPVDGRYTYGYTGAGVTAYVVDSGIRYSHVEFEGRARPGFDAYGSDGSDCLGHGTHVAATIGGKSYGVAKDVELVSVRVLDCRGGGSWADLIAALDWVIQDASGPSVVNISLGGAPSETGDEAVQRVIDAGIPVTLAAMNSHYDACRYSPGRVVDAMTIGASDENDRRASFSNYGSCIDWFAPGVGILSANWMSDAGAEIRSGTSMAAPHTAGVAALLLEETPTLTPLALRDAIWDRTTKNVVYDALSENAHMLFAHSSTDADRGDPPGAGPLAAPVNLTATSSTANVAIDVTWSNVEPRATVVETWWRPTGGAWTSVSHEPSASSYSLSGLQESTSYEFRARTGVSSGTTWEYSDWTATVSATTCAANPKGKRGVCATDGSGDAKGGGAKGKGPGG